jgi:hypothetical protein
MPLGIAKFREALWGVVARLVIVGALFALCARLAQADSYCEKIYKLDHLSVSEQLGIYKSLNKGGHISTATWDKAEARYQQAFRSFNPTSTETYCDDDAKTAGGLDYTLHVINGYLYKGSDVKWAANWLQILEQYIGREELTPNLYRSLAATVLRALKESHEKVSSDFRDLANKYGATDDGQGLGGS